MCLFWFAQKEQQQQKKGESTAEVIWGVDQCQGISTL